MKGLVFIAMQICMLAPGALTVAATAQTIPASNPDSKDRGTAPMLTATARPGAASLDPAHTAQQTFSANAVVPGKPLITSLYMAVGSTSVDVGFQAPSDDGGAPITKYTVTASPGNISASGSNSPITVSGLTFGTYYRFVVTATNSAGEGPASAQSPAVTVRDKQTITFDNPGDQPFGTTRQLSASSTSGLPISFASNSPNVCTVTPMGQVSTRAPGSCTIIATQAGDTTYGDALEVKQTFAITVPGGAVSFSTPFSLPSATGGVPYSWTITAIGGAPPYRFSKTSGNLPTGMTLNGAGILSGTPVSAGPFSFTVEVTDQATQTATQSFQLEVKAPGITLSPSTLPNGRVGTQYSTTLSATGGKQPYSYTITSGSLPDGLSLSAGGVLSGTPKAAVTENFTITATDGNSFTGSAPYTITVGHAAPVAADKTATTSYATDVAIDLSGSITGADISTVTIMTAPAHGTVSIAGEVATYRPDPGFFGGTDSFTYTATNPGGTSAPATVTVTVQPRSPLVFTPGAGALPPASVDTAYATQITATNGTGPYSYAITTGTLPAGLSFDATSGAISGTPTEVGSSTITVTATDHLGFTGTASYALAVAAPSITAPSLNASVVAGTNTIVDLTTGATGGPFTDARLVSLTPASAGTATIIFGDTADAGGAMMASLVAAGRYKLKFTPSPTFSGTAVATYTLSNRYATSAPATISFSVAALPDPTKDSDIAGLANAEAEAAKRFAAMALDNLNGHLEQLHGGGCLANRWGVNLNDTRPGKEKEAQAPGMADRIGASNDAQDRRAMTPDTCSPFADGALAFWTGGSVNFGSTDFTDNGKNFDFTTFGLSAGMDYRFSERFAAGLGISMGSDRSFIGDNGTRSNGLAYSAAVYGSYHPANGVFLDGVAGYGWLRFDSKRFDAPAGALFDGSRDGRQIFASVTTGYETTINGVFISPYLRMSASRSSLDAFSENSTAWSAIRYGDQTIDTFTGMLGLRLGYPMPTDWGVFTPKLRLEYGHDFASASSLSLTYANLTGSPSYLLTTAGSARDHATVTLGADMRVGPDWTLGADYGFTIDGRSGVGPQQFRLQVGAKF